jgi:aminoglycoside phosphotransferase (APT) family kinase protein
VDTFPTSLVPLAGGHSGETFLAEVAGEQTVVRVYGPRSAWRGPLAPEVDAAVLEMVRGLVPVPDVLEVRRADPDVDLPGLLVVSWLPGERLDLVLPRLDDTQLARVGAELGTLVGRLGHMVQPRPGVFTDRSLALAEVPRELRDLPAWVEFHAEHLEPSLVEDLRRVAADAQDLLDVERRTCLVHSDLNAKNLLVDPETLEVTGVLDWEFAHSGLPWSDLGNLLRFERHPVLVEAVLAAYTELMPTVPDNLLDLARAADLFALVDLAARQDANDVVLRAREHLWAIARSGDLHAAP